MKTSILKNSIISTLSLCSFAVSMPALAAHQEPVFSEIAMNPVAFTSSIVEKSNIITGTTFVVPLEQFKVCKNLAASIVYKMNNKVLASALDLHTLENPALVDRKKANLKESFTNLGVENPEGVSNEFFNLLNFYLTKNNTIDANRMNTFLTNGKISDVQLTCRDRFDLQNSEYLDAGQKEAINPVLFSQSVK